jgi:hypothetical protein
MQQEPYNRRIFVQDGQVKNETLFPNDQGKRAGGMAL